MGIRPERGKICSKAREISLTKKEFDILNLLAANKGRAAIYE